MLAANVIAENMLSQIDDEGQHQMLLDGVVDHRTLQDAIRKSQGTYVDANGRTQTKQTTRGWDLLVEWKDGSSNWIALKDLKESYPIQVADTLLIIKLRMNQHLHGEFHMSWRSGKGY